MCYDVVLTRPGNRLILEPMSVPTASKLGANLRRLRSAKHLTQTDLAAKAGLSRVAYRNIESGAAEPRVNTLLKISDALGVRVQDLLVPTDPITHVRFRADKRMTSRETILSDVARWLGDYSELEELLDDRRTWTLEALAKKASSPKSKRDLVELAKEARRVMGIDPRAVIRNMGGLLEANGIKVLTPRVASEGFFGLSVGPEGGGPAVAVNVWDRISVERWIFTAAHELGHLLMHRTAYDVSRTEENEKEEREADRFAGHFLVPTELLERELGHARGVGLVDAVFTLKRMFHVSYRTILYRMGEDKPLARRKELWARFYEEYERETGKRLRPTDEPEGLDPDAFSVRPPDRGADEPERLAQYDFREAWLFGLVRQAVEAEVITLARAAEILELSTEKMLSLANSWVK